MIVYEGEEMEQAKSKTLKIITTNTNFIGRVASTIRNILVFDEIDTGISRNSREKSRKENAWNCKKTSSIMCNTSSYNSGTSEIIIIIYLKKMKKEEQRQA